MNMIKFGKNEYENEYKNEYENTRMIITNEVPRMHNSLFAVHII